MYVCLYVDCRIDNGNDTKLNVLEFITLDVNLNGMMMKIHLDNDPFVCAK